MKTTILALHIAAGSVALLSMFVPMVAHKGGRLHRRSGWVFVAGMAIVSVTALLLSGARLLFDPTPAGRDAGLFLLLVSVLTASGVSAGMRVLRFKARTTVHRHSWDLGMPALLVVMGAGIGVYGATRGSILFVAFAALGLASGIGDLRYWLRPPSSRTHWWFQHMSSMLGACIAATTAFLVNTADNFGIWPLAAWLAPSIVGTPAIAIWTAYYKRRFAAKETAMPAPSHPAPSHPRTPAPSHPRTPAPSHRIAREAARVAVLALIVFSPAMATLFAQAPAALQQGPDLVAGLKNTPGVLGVDTARTSSGKQVIFAWFANKQAVLNWFYSEAHQTAMHMFTPGASSGRAPLADIKDDSGPILAVASLTLADTPHVEGVKLRVSQIAIELYAPLPGGLAVGGRFAPATMKVPGLIEQ